MPVHALCLRVERLTDSSRVFDEAELVQWIEHSLVSGSNDLAAGYQGQTLKYVNGDQRLVIKVPHGRGLLKAFNIHLLKHEAQVYRKLQGFEGVPECHGLVAGKYLVLELIDGTTMKQQRPSDETRYFNTMLEYVQRMHALGVAHFDLKKKTNLLVVDGKRPCLIDLGVAIIYKPGFHPLNHYLFRLAKCFDYNAWIRHKYNNQLADISAADRPYYNKTWIERYAYRIKRFYKDKFKPIFRRNTRR